MAIKAVFFDMGETLCYQVPPTSQLLGELLAKRGIVVAPKALRKCYLAAMTYYSTWALQVDASERTEEQREIMIQEFYRVMLGTLALDDHLEIIPDLRDALAERGERPFKALFPDTVPALDALQARGLRLGIISNWDATLVSLVHDLGLSPFMEVVVGSVNVGVEKPNPLIFQHALARMRIEAEEACHVGDMYYMDILGARASGLTPVLVDRHGLQLNVDCLRVDNLVDLPGILPRPIAGAQD